MAVVTDEIMKLLEEVKKDPAAYQRLKNKCQWERETQTYVLRNWGDPRTW